MEMIPDKHKVDKGSEHVANTPRQPEMAVRVMALGGLVLLPLLGAASGIRFAEISAKEHNQNHIRVAKKADRCAKFVTERGGRIEITQSRLPYERARDCGVNTSAINNSSNVLLELPSVESSQELAKYERGRLKKVGFIERVFSALAGTAFIVSVPVLVYGTSLVAEYVRKKSKKIASWTPQKKEPHG